MENLNERNRSIDQRLEPVRVFAREIAHEFNSLLTNIRINVSLARLNANEGGKKVSAPLDDAENACDRAAKLTGQILEFSNIAPTRKKTVQIEPLLAEIVKRYCTGSGVTARLDSPEIPVHVNGVPELLVKAFDEVIKNACESMHDMGRLEVTVERTGGNSEIASVTVRDTGIGMPEKYLGRVFDPFFTTKQKGSGLGLARAFSIVKNHDGTMDIDSEMGKGSTVRVTLPTCEVPESPDIENVPAGIVSRRILIIEPEERERLFAQDVLHRAGHHTDFADDYQRAVDLFKTALESKTPFDAVIMDVEKGNCMKTVKTLYQIYPEVKTIASKRPMDGKKTSVILNYGFNDSLYKPYSEKNLRETITRLFD